MIRKSSSSGFSCERKSVALVVFVVILVDDVVNLPMPLLLSLTICSPLFLPHIGQKVICKILYFLSVLFWWFCFFFFLFFTQCCFFFVVICVSRAGRWKMWKMCATTAAPPPRAPLATPGLCQRRRRRRCPLRGQQIKWKINENCFVSFLLSFEYK